MEGDWLEFLNRPVVVLILSLLGAGVVAYVVRRFYFPPGPGEDEEEREKP